VHVKSGMPGFKANSLILYTVCRYASASGRRTSTRKSWLRPTTTRLILLGDWIDYLMLIASATPTPHTHICCSARTSDRQPPELPFFGRSVVIDNSQLLRHNGACSIAEHATKKLESSPVVYNACMVSAIRMQPPSASLWFDSTRWTLILSAGMKL
jgi:hypothetical protein